MAATAPSAVGYPFRAESNWARDPDVPGSIDLCAGDEGKVVGEKSELGWVQISIPKRNIKLGIVPKTCLLIGTERKYGEWAVQTNMGWSIPRIPATPPSGTLLYKAACVALAAICENKHGLQEFSPKIFRILGDRTQIEGIAAAFHQGLKNAGLAEVLARPHHTLLDILSAAKEIKSSSSWVPEYVVYAWVHSNFADPARNPAIAVGSTNEATRRRREHVDAHAKETAPQYVAWRTSEDHVMLADVLLVCELLTMLLLDTHHPGFRVALDRPFTPVNVELPANDDDIPTHDLPADIKMSTTNTLGGSADMQTLGTKLMTLMTAVNNRTGWHGGCRRPEFRGSGLNWHTPLIMWGDNNSQIVTWNKTTIPGVMDVYSRTTPICGHFKTKIIHGQAIEDVDRVELHLFGRQRDDLTTEAMTLDVHNASQSGIVKGTKLWTTIEIMHEGSATIPWARAPSLGEYADQDLVNRVQISVRFQTPQGTTKRFYMQITDDFQYFNWRPLKSYVDGIAIYHYLRGERVQHDRPIWWRDIGVAAIQELEFDHLSQIMRITYSQNTTIIPPPVRVSDMARIRYLETKGASSFGDCRSAIRPGTDHALVDGFPSRKYGLKDDGTDGLVCDFCKALMYDDAGAFRVKKLPLPTGITSVNHGKVIVRCRASEQDKGNCKAYRQAVMLLPLHEGVLVTTNEPEPLEFAERGPGGVFTDPTTSPVDSPGLTTPGASSARGETQTVSGGLRFSKLDLNASGQDKRSQSGQVRSGQSGSSTGRSSGVGDQSQRTTESALRGQVRSGQSGSSTGRSSGVGDQSQRTTESALRGQVRSGQSGSSTGRSSGVGDHSQRTTESAPRFNIPFDRRTFNNHLDEDSLASMLSAANMIEPQVRSNPSLGNPAGAQYRRQLLYVRARLTHFGTDWNAQQAIAALDTAHAATGLAFTLSTMFTDKDGNPIQNRPPNMEELRRMLSRYSQGFSKAELEAIHRYISDLGIIMRQRVKDELAMLSDAILSRQ
ncbi:hypothetical protein LTR29_017696 [Friedmanniomyces endolithicus]|nr:hypothetical protein LTR29_017696 [Friedmanniomyces endolithicus]